MYTEHIITAAHTHHTNTRSHAKHEEQNHYTRIQAPNLYSNTPPDLPSPLQPGDVDLETLFGNMAEVVALSQSLLTALEEATAGREFDDQLIGQSAARRVLLFLSSQSVCRTQSASFLEQSESRRTQSDILFKYILMEIL